jgi:dihydroorotase
LIVDLALRNCRIPLENRIVEAEIAVDDGKIHTIAKAANLPKASEKVNVKYNIVLPGLIDAHVHLRDLELAYKEDFHSGTCAAIAGGFTTVLDMPNTKPPTNSANRLKEKMEKARSKIVSNVGFFIGYPTTLEELSSIKKIGALGLKIYPYQNMGRKQLAYEDLLYQTLKATKETELILLVHAEDPTIIEREEKILRKEQKISYRTLTKIHPPEAEIKAIEKICRIATKIRSPIHICHISLPDSVTLINEAKKNGGKLSCEVTPHHLLLTDKAVDEQEGFAIMNPPLRDYNTNQRLWNMLKKGSIDIIASDHAPHTSIEKKEMTPKATLPGIPGLETALPLLLTQVSSGRASLFQLISVLAENPAQIFHIKNKGCLKPGCDADLTIVDLKERFTIDSSKFHSKAKYTPFEGFKVKGRPVKVMLNGKIAMEDGEIWSKPGGAQVILPDR